LVGVRSRRRVTAENNSPLGICKRNVRVCAEGRIYAGLRRFCHGFPGPAPVGGFKNRLLQAHRITVLRVEEPYSQDETRVRRLREFSVGLDLIAEAGPSVSGFRGEP